MTVAVAVLYRKTARTSFHALVGAQETAADLTSIPVHFAPDAAALERAIRQERAAGRRVLVGWSFYSPEVFEVGQIFRQILGACGRQGVLHVAGGVHASAEPLATLRMGFDLVAIGEGETTWIHLLRALLAGDDPRSVPGLAWEEDGLLRDRGRAETRDLDVYPSFAMAHGRWGAIEITRGCIYACRFCQTPYFFKARFRHRSVESVQDHARYLRRHGQRDVRFLTPTSLSYGADGEEPRLDRVEALLRGVRDAIGPDGRIFFGSFPSEVRPEHVTPEAIRLLRPLVANEALLIGGQSGSQRMLDATRRGHSAASILEAARLAREGGFVPHIDFLFGMPGEEEDDATASRALMQELVRLGAKVHAHTFLPLPGTPLRDAEAGALDPATALHLERLASRGLAYGQWRRQRAVAEQLVQLRRAR
ncbi:MAG: TIGR04013 family B12-binding domain/radical SAM domain-containing protein [Myxococcales bacterium]|nr:TIGR04013 family B12-binding domain/radical SAM domain-containing protein [Polyangiaceae bacterium]MDW8251271.1 TIGR04013 family B12-binding domain/radical SAM domain-containing protein [Myxococcales bacterium]